MTTTSTSLRPLPALFPFGNHVSADQSRAFSKANTTQGCHTSICSCTGNPGCPRTLNTGWPNKERTAAKHKYRPHMRTPPAKTILVGGGAENLPSRRRAETRCTRPFPAPVRESR